MSPLAHEPHLRTPVGMSLLAQAAMVVVAVAAMAVGTDTGVATTGGTMTGVAHKQRVYVTPHMHQCFPLSQADAVQST